MLKKASQAVMYIKDFLFDLIFPIQCFGCGMYGTYLCAPCFAKIPVAETPVCPQCGAPSFENATCKGCRKITRLDGVIAATLYTVPLVRRLIMSLKYRFIKPLAVPLSQLLLKHITEHNYALFARRDMVFVPLPLSSRRLRSRGFNQAQEIALQLASVLGIPVAGHALKRTRNTMPQTETKSRAERLQNMEGAFAVENFSGIKNKAVVLVDDVATTCATLSECAKVLKAAGAKEVWGLVVAREPFASGSA